MDIRSILSAKARVVRKRPKHTARRAGASNTGRTITTEYVDDGVSGSKESRLELNQLMADAHRRKFDAVLSLIQERVRAGLRTAPAKGKKFRRPRVEIDAVRVAELRSEGFSWSKVCRTLNVSKGSAQRSVARL